MSGVKPFRASKAILNWMPSDLRKRSSHAEPPKIYIPACGVLCDVFWWARRDPPAEPPAPLPCEKTKLREVSHFLIRAAFFDAAGTLFESREPIGRTYARLAREFGLDASEDAVAASFRRAFGDAPGLAFGPGLRPDEIRRLERQWWRRRVSETFAPLGRFADFDAYFDAFFACFANPEHWIADVEAAPMLQRLKSDGLKLGVISNFDFRLYRILDGLDLTRFFDSITISSEAGYAKPRREVYDAALARAGVQRMRRCISATRSISTSRRRRRWHGRDAYRSRDRQAAPSISGPHRPNSLACPRPRGCASIWNSLDVIAALSLCKATISRGTAILGTRQMNRPLFSHRLTVMLIAFFTLAFTASIAAAQSAGQLESELAASPARCRPPSPAIRPPTR